VFLRVCRAFGGLSQPKRNRRAGGGPPLNYGGFRERSAFYWACEESPAMLPRLNCSEYSQRLLSLHHTPGLHSDSLNQGSNPCPLAKKQGGVKPPDSTSRFFHLTILYPVRSSYLSFSSTSLAEDLQHKSFSGSVPKYTCEDKCHPDYSKNPAQAPSDKKS
jgi:hypothetical protein